MFHLSLPLPNKKTIVLKLVWYVPITNLSDGGSIAQNPQSQASKGSSCGCNNTCKNYHKPCYAGVFSGIDAVLTHWREQYAYLKRQSEAFSSSFFDSSLPVDVLEAVAANLGILKTPTVHRQTDGRIWAYEGCLDDEGCCPGSCTHVWNYAQAIPHLFPVLERGFRQSEFNEAQNESDHQQYRVNLPISPTTHDFHSAVDGQLGEIMKVYRDWRISGDNAWLRGLWPKVCLSLDYCIETWDPRHTGTLEEPPHNTYDIEFWGPDSMTSSFYLGALNAA